MKAELKYFIMISPTLLGKLKKSRAIRIKWYGTEPYALAKSSQIRCNYILSLLSENIEFQIICECSRHPGRPGIPAFWIDVFIWWLLIRKVVIRWARTPKNIFPSMFRKDIGQKFVIPFDCISFDIQIPSTRHHSCGAIPFFQACWRRTVSFLRTHGQFLYNLYDIPFMPRALPAWALWMKSRTSFSFIPLSSNMVGSWGLVNLLVEVLGYRLNHLSMSSTSDSWVPPLVHQACHSLIPQKDFCESIRIWVEWSPSLMLFLLMFSLIFISTKILFWISFRIFWSSNLSWIGASFNWRFSILCSDLNFPFCLFGHFSSV